MSIEFDPKARSATISPAAEESVGSNSETSQQSLDPYDPLFNPPVVVHELDLLLSGAKQIDQLRREHPFATIDIPSLASDILGPLPVLGSSSKKLTKVIKQYQVSKENLSERRKNFSQALEGHLTPYEAMDLHLRIEEIDRASLQLEQELEKAIRLKQERLAFEQAEIQRQLKEEQKAEEEARARWEEWNNEGGN